MKIYVLQATCGSYNEVSKWILGVFDNKELVEKEKVLYDYSIKFDNNKYSGEEQKRLSNLEDDLYKQQLDEDLFSDDIKEFIKWRDLMYEELHDSHIEEYELNKLNFEL